VPSLRQSSQPWAGSAAGKYRTPSRTSVEPKSR